jgi:hypothetical protein
VVVLMSTQRGEGDLIVTGTTNGYLFIIGGLAAAALAIMRTKPAGPPGQWLLGGAAGDRPPR